MFGFFNKNKPKIQRFFKNYFNKISYRNLTKFSVVDPNDTKLIHQKIHQAFRDKEKLQIVIKSKYHNYNETSNDYIVDTEEFITTEVANTFIKVIADFDYGHLVNVDRISNHLIIIKIRKGKEE